MSRCCIKYSDVADRGGKYRERGTIVNRYSRRDIPALAINTSNRPACSCIAVLTALASSHTSARQVNTVILPFSVASALSASALAGLRAVAKILTSGRSARSWVKARPRPRLAPVTGDSVYRCGCVMSYGIEGDVGRGWERACGKEMGQRGGRGAEGTYRGM